MPSQQPSKHQSLKSEKQRKKEHRTERKHHQKALADYLAQQPNEKLVLCLDIDETFMNAKTKPYSRIDINGSDIDGDASAWIQFLDEMTQYCADRSITLIIQVISAKEDALPDSTVKIISDKLYPFLFIHDTKGDPIEHNNANLLRRYHFNERANYQYNRRTWDIHLDSSIDLPPLHLACWNEPLPKEPNRYITNKAHPMDTIRTHFNLLKKRVFLLDNDPYHLKTIEQEGYIPLSAEELGRNVSSLQSDKAERTQSFQLVIERAKLRMKQEVEAIVIERTEAALKALKQSRTQPRFFKNPKPTVTCSSVAMTP